ncbi:MAG: hypothetical protein KF752_12955 [Pirellulaceae bacterium]|nr:hypothetical protein [Pirellulaceae bacterium]
MCRSWIHEPPAYSEDQLVEQPSIGLIAALGWQTVSALEETLSADGTVSCNLSRETKGELELVNLELNEDNCQLIEDAALDNEQERLTEWPPIP